MSLDCRVVSADFAVALTVMVIARYETPFWRQRRLAGAALSHIGPFCEFHDHTGPDTDQSALFAFAPAARLGGKSIDEITAAFREHAARLFGPEAHETGDILVTDWSREVFTSATRPAHRSSHWYCGTPALRLPHIGGRVIFGSTETGSAFPGYLEGAVLAGKRAASQALDHLG
jgi:monoamine oxidase